MLALAGCSGPTGSPTPGAGATTAPSNGPSNAPPTSAAVDRTLATLQTAVRAQDEAAFRSVTGTQDGFASTVDLVWANLVALGLTGFDWTATGVTGELAAPRRDHLGAGARLVQTEVSWSVPGDPFPARQLGWLTLVPGDDDRLRVVATTDRPTTPSAPPPTPLWLLEPLGRTTGSRSTVLGGRSVDLPAWTGILDRAARAVTQRVPRQVRPRWNGRLVAELPSNERLVEQVLGAAPDSRRGIAAITWPESTASATAPLRIVVNPAPVQHVATLGLDVLATHEATHVATRSPLSSAPLWLVEGYADWVAYDTWPAAVEPALEPLLAEVAAGRAPSGLPADADFDAGSPDLALRYAEAWTACRFVAENRGAATLGALYAAAQHAEVEDALTTVLGQSRAAFVRAWRADLVRQATRRPEPRPGR